jgi:hypothetical protein
MKPRFLLRSRRIFITHIRQVGGGDDVSPGSDEEPVNIRRSGHRHNKGRQNTIIRTFSQPTMRVSIAALLLVAVAQPVGE